MTSNALSDFQESLEEILRKNFKLKNFRQGQLDILKTTLQGQDGIAVMPTGGGKSLCFQIPAIFHEGIVIAISPLISLMRDQVKGLKSIGIPAGCLHSGQEISEKREVFRELKKNKHYILYLAPERVQKPTFLDWLKDKKIILFAIDESHCVSQWGHDFRPDYQRLTLLREVQPEVPILALTATATPRVLGEISRHLKLKKPRRHIHGFYRPNLFYQVENCENNDMKFAFLKQAIAQNPNGRILIYCGTRKQTETLTERLAQEFEEIAFYHAGLDSETRHQVQKRYEKSEVRILVATNAFGMGIDHPDIRLVVHYQMPANIESLYQEMGRAGRDGQESTCLLLYAKRDRGLQAFFINQSDAPRSHIRYRWEALETITQFAEGAECRHGGILTYFRDAQRIRSCGHCDTCDPNSKRRIQTPILPEMPKPSLKRRQKTTLLEEPLSEEAQLRYEILREWRKNFAQEKDIPAFLVFSNKTLKDLAQKAPSSLDELEQVHGFGPHKVEHLGSSILDQLKQARV